jgi:hypothetical protein
MLNFRSLSRNERRAATKLAKELLRTVPAAQNADEPLSIRGALSTAFMKPENVIGALVYTDLEGNWWGDVALRKGKRKCFQMGSREEPPLQSCEDALECVKNLIASIKATREHPIVQEFRERGFDPEQIELLRVRHEKFGCRWVLLDEKQICQEPRHSQNSLSANSEVSLTSSNKREQSYYEWHLSSPSIRCSYGPQAAMMSKKVKFSHCTLRQRS